MIVRVLSHGKKSAGLLIQSQLNGELEVFLVCPEELFWVRKDLGSQSTPNGKYNYAENIMMLQSESLEVSS